MNKVIRVISALGAGASLVWGITRSLRRKRGNTDDGGPDWPPRDAEKAARGESEKKADAKKAPKAEAKPEPKKADAEPQKVEPKKADAKTVEPKKADAKKVEPEKSEAKTASDAKEAAPAADASGPTVVKGVELENPKAVVELVNSIDEEGLKDLGIKGAANQKVLDTRPIETVHDLAVPGIGRRTLQALAGATE